MWGNYRLSARVTLPETPKRVKYEAKRPEGPPARCRPGEPPEFYSKTSYVIVFPSIIVTLRCILSRWGAGRIGVTAT